MPEATLAPSGNQPPRVDWLDGSEGSHIRQSKDPSIHFFVCWLVLESVLQKNHIRSDPGCLDANVEGVEDGHGDEASSAAGASRYTEVRCGALLASTLETSDDDEEDVMTYSLSL